MKKFIYLLCVLTWMLQACTSDDSAILSSQTKEAEVSGSGPEKSDVSACKKILCEASGGWKMEYEPATGDKYTFYFRFQNNGLVETDSDIPEGAIFTIFSFEPDSEKLRLKIQGGGHLRLIGEERMEEILKIESYSATQIICSGSKHGLKMNMTPASTTEIQDMQKQKKMLVALMKRDLFRGTIRENGKLIAHYSLEYRKDKITFSYFEGRSLKHKELPLEKSYNAFVWSEIDLGSHQISGIKYDAVTDKVLLIGSSIQDLSLVSNASAVHYMDNRSRQFQLSKTQSIGDAKDELYEETTWEHLRVMELNCTNSKRPIVVCLNSGYIFYDATDVDNSLLTKEANDIVYFRNITGGSPQFGGTEAQKVEANQKLKKLLNAWFHKDGLIVIQVNETNDTYLYLLSPTTDSWFKIKKTAG